MLPKRIIILKMSTNIAFFSVDYDNTHPNSCKKYSFFHEIRVYTMFFLCYGICAMSCGFIAENTLSNSKTNRRVHLW